MNISNAIGATAIALLWLPASGFASVDGPGSVQHVVASADGSSEKPMMARGTDLRPCKPGTYSEFSRQTGGYHCARKP